MALIRELLPLYKETYCENHSCPDRHLMTKRSIAAYKILTVARVLFLVICAAVLGGAAHSFIFGQQFEPFTQAILSERITKTEVELEGQRTEVALLRQTVAQQEKDISEMHGIGIGLGSILIILQVIQMVAGRLIGLTAKRE